MGTLKAGPVSMNMASFRHLGRQIYGQVPRVLTLPDFVKFCGRAPQNSSLTFSSTIRPFTSCVDKRIQELGFYLIARQLGLDVNVTKLEQMIKELHITKDGIPRINEFPANPQFIKLRQPAGKPIDTYLSGLARIADETKVLEFPTEEKLIEIIATQPPLCGDTFIIPALNTFAYLIHPDDETRQGEFLAKAFESIKKDTQWESQVLHNQIAFNAEQRIETPSLQLEPKKTAALFTATYQESLRESGAQFKTNVWLLEQAEELWQTSVTAQIEFLMAIFNKQQGG